LGAKIKLDRPKQGSTRICRIDLSVIACIIKRTRTSTAHSRGRSDSTSFGAGFGGKARMVEFAPSGDRAAEIRPELVGKLHCVAHCRSLGLDPGTSYGIRSGVASRKTELPTVQPGVRSQPQASVSCLSASARSRFICWRSAMISMSSRLSYNSDQMLEALIAVAPALYLLGPDRDDGCGEANPHGDRRRQ
jgi:hypothetical protein